MKDQLEAWKEGDPARSESPTAIMLLPRGLSRVELTHLISSQLADGIKVGAFDGEPAGLGAHHDAKFRMPTHVSSVIRIRSGFYWNAPVGMIRAHVVPRARGQTLLITLSFVSLDPTRVNSLTDKKKVASAHFVFAIGSGHGATGRPIPLPPVSLSDPRFPRGFVLAAVSER